MKGIQQTQATALPANRGRLLEWAGAIAVIAAVLISTLIVGELQKRADEYRRVETLLARLNSTAFELNALEWEAIGRKEISAEARQRLAVVHNESTVTIWQLALTSHESEPIEEVSRRYKAYVQIADREFRLIEAGKFAEAQALDAQKVDPAFRALTKAIGDATVQYVHVADRRIRTANASAMLTVLFTTVVIGFLFWQLSRKRMASRLAAAEQKVLNAANEALQAEIDGRKQVERQLVDTLNFNRAMLEASPVGIIVYKPSGEVAWTNEAAAAIVGGTVKQLAAQNFRQLESWKKSGLLAAAELTLSTGTEQEIEAHASTSFGKDIWLSSRFVTFQCEGESHLLGLFADITERKRMEESLRHSEERYRNLVESAQDIVFTISPDAGLTSLNLAFETITGRPRAEWVGKPFPPLVHPEDLPLAQEMFQRVLAGERPPLFGLRILSQSAQPLCMEFTVTPQRADGQVVGVLGVGRDVTARMLLEDRYRQAQKMEAVGQLAGGVAHDFNNLLTVIQGNVSLAQMSGATGAEQAHSLEEIARASERAASLVRQLLTFGRRQVPQPRNLDLNAIVQHTSQMLQRLIGEHITLATRTAPDSAPIHADPVMMEQVLINLTVNARDAMPTGGRLTIQTAVVLLDGEALRFRPQARPGRFVRLSVTDTGSGIAPEHLPHIFEPFFTTKDVGKGTGLGLASVFGVIEQHQGWIEVESQAGIGTGFHIHLPCSAKEADAEAKRPAAKREAGGTETILLVEDEPPVRMMVRMILERHGYRVHEADSGVTALGVWQEHRERIDLLLTDMVMPGGLNGQELAERLLSEKPGLKVIYTSGYSDEMFGDNSPLRNNSNFLKKPYEVNALLTMVRACLEAR